MCTQIELFARSSDTVYVISCPEAFDVNYANRLDRGLCSLWLAPRGNALDVSQASPIVPGRRLMELQHDGYSPLEMPALPAATDIDTYLSFQEHTSSIPSFTGHNMPWPSRRLAETKPATNVNTSTVVSTADSELDDNQHDVDAMSDGLSESQPGLISSGAGATEKPAVYDEAHSIKRSSRKERRLQEVCAGCRPFPVLNIKPADCYQYANQPNGVALFLLCKRHAQNAFFELRRFARCKRNKC